MVFKNEEGREVEMYVFDDGVNLVVDEAYYLDSADEEVTEYDIAYILDRYSAEIEETLLEQSDGDYIEYGDAS